MPSKRAFVPDDQWRLRAVADPRVSPDGTTVAFVVATPDRETDKAATTIWVAPADGSEAARQFTAGPEDHSPRWSPDGRWLAFVADRGHEPQVHLAPLAGGEPKAVTDAPWGAAQPAWSPDGTTLAYVARTGDWKKPDDRSAIEKSAPRVVAGLYNRFDGVGWFDERRTHVFTVPVGGGEARRLTDGDWNDAEPAWSPDGRAVAFTSDRSSTRWDEVHRDVWVVPARGARRARRLTRGRGTSSSPQWSPDGSLVAYVGHEHPVGDSASNAHLLVVDAASPAAPRSLSAPLDRGVWGLQRPPGRTFAWAADGASLLFIAFDRGAFAVYRTGVDDPSPELVAGGDRQCLALDASATTGIVAVASQWLSDPPEVHVIDEAGGLRRISDVNAALRAVRLAKAKRVSHTMTDGVKVESFVLYPQGHRRGRAAPTVLEIHGGPHSFHPQVVLLGLYQSLVAAGYMVVLPNPRGSQGYGEAFSQAVVGDWGGRDFGDLMAVMDRLVESGDADPARLYVAGYSYGGFMTSWVVGHTDRFAAACPSAAVTDLASMWGTTDIPDFAEREVGGLPWEQPALFAARSPVSALAAIKTPVQIFHWDGDLRCPPGQADELFQGLRRLGREVVMVRYPGGFHIIRSPSQMADFASRHLDWFGSH